MSKLNSNNSLVTEQLSFDAESNQNNITKVIPLPKVSNTPAKKNLIARNKLNKAIKNAKNEGNELTNPSKAKTIAVGKYANSDSKDLPVNLEAILEQPLVEEISPEYFDLILGNRKLDNSTKEKCLEFINSTIRCSDPAIAEHFRNLCIDITDTIRGKKDRISLLDYLNACKFVTYRASGDNKTRAYSKTFPERVMRMQKEGQSMSHLNSYAEIYSKNKAVAEVHAKVLLPTHIMYHDLVHQGFRTLAEIINDDSISPKTRVDAANAIITHAKQPEIKQTELAIKVDDTNIINQLKDAMSKMASNQVKLLQDNEVTIENVANQIIYTEESNNEET